MTIPSWFVKDCSVSLIHVHEASHESHGMWYSGPKTLRSYQQLMQGVHRLEVSWDVILFEHSPDLFRRSFNIRQYYWGSLTDGFLGCCIYLSLSNIIIDVVTREKSCRF